MTKAESDFLSQFHLSFFKGRVINVEPVTYDHDTGVIWEQDIDFQLENGITIPLSDNDLGCKLEDIGKEKRIQMITAFHSIIEKCDSDNPEIGISLDPPNPRNSPKISGIIRKIVEPPEEKYRPYMRYAALDVGIGQILIELYKDHKGDFSVFREGDCISFTGRLDVLNVR